MTTPAGWQPISTAPKDGSVLGYTPSPSRIFIMRWDGGGYTKDPGWRTSTFPFVKIDPKFWMPLPEPPA